MNKFRGFLSRVELVVGFLIVAGVVDSLDHWKFFHFSVSFRGSLIIRIHTKRGLPRRLFYDGSWSYLCYFCGSFDLRKLSTSGSLFGYRSLFLWWRISSFFSSLKLTIFGLADTLTFCILLCLPRCICRLGGMLATG